MAVFKAIFTQSAAVRPSRPVPLGQSWYIFRSVSGAMALMSKASSLQWYGKLRGHALQLLGHSPWRLPEPNLRHSASSCRHPAWGSHTIINDSINDWASVLDVLAGIVEQNMASLHLKASGLAGEWQKLQSATHQGLRTAISRSMDTYLARM